MTRRTRLLAAIGILVASGGMWGTVLHFSAQEAPKSASSLEPTEVDRELNAPEETISFPEGITREEKAEYARRAEKKDIASAETLEQLSDEFTASASSLKREEQPSGQVLAERANLLREHAQIYRKRVKLWREQIARLESP